LRLKTFNLVVAAAFLVGIVGIALPVASAEELAPAVEPRLCITLVNGAVTWCPAPLGPVCVNFVIQACVDPTP